MLAQSYPAGFRVRGLSPAPRNDSGETVSLTFTARWLVSRPTHPFSRTVMAKAVSTKIKLVSSADTGFYYVTKKNSRTMTEKLKMKKYDPIAKKHVEFVEGKIK
jgi:large subunit ribosomal protein L33